MRYLLILTSFLILLNGFGQDSTININFNKKHSFLDYSPKINPSRLGLVAGGTTALYAGALVGLNYLWYEGYPRSGFHSFNDMGEWNQMDKLGHLQTAYFESFSRLLLLSLA